MDNLKKINDIYGHKAGDRALKCLGKLLQKRADQGISCRLGGDEFLMFLPDTDPGSLSLQMDDLFQKFHTSLPMIRNSVLPHCPQDCVCAAPMIPLRTAIPKQIKLCIT